MALRFRFALTALAAVAALAPPPAVAQEADAYRGVRAVQELDAAVERAWMLASEEHPGTAFTAGLHRLMREAGHLELRDASVGAMERFEAEYRRTRRALHRPGAMPSEALLDAWDDVAAAWRALNERVPMGSEATYLRFEGRFGTVPVALTGATLAELHDECMRLTRRLDVVSPQRVEIRGRVLPIRTEPYDPAELCGIAALNAEAIGGAAPVLLGAVEGIPFVLYGPTDDALDALHRYMPPVLHAMPRVDDLRVGSRRYHALRSWTPREVIRLLERQLLGDEPERFSWR